MFAPILFSWLLIMVSFSTAQLRVNAAEELRCDILCQHLLLLFIPMEAEGVSVSGRQ